MARSLARRIAGAITAILLASCGASPPAGGTQSEPAEFMAVGTFNSLNAEAGTINISHAPVPAAGWPAMTMDFKLTEPTAATNLKPGDRVDIHFTIESGMNATITHLAPIEPRP